MYEHKLQITMIPLIYFSDSKSLIVLYLLHSIFIPTSKKVTRDENGKKGFIKFSIKDSLLLNQQLWKWIQHFKICQINVLSNHVS